MVGGGPRELVLVSGYSGVGKSSVVNELHRALVPPRGLFASGKFDQVKRDIPYATLAQAFQSLVRSLLGKSDAELASWRVELREALAPNGRLKSREIRRLCRGGSRSLTFTAVCARVSLSGKRFARCIRAH